MSHSHHHHHEHHLPNKLNFAFAVSISLNLLYTISQVIFAVHANSMSLMADAVHNFGDVFGLLLAWGASWLLTLKTTERFSYGYKRTSILAALINALILVGTSCVIAYESIFKLLYAEEVKALVVVIVALVGIVINTGTALLFFKDRHHDLNIKGAFLHLASDALVSFGVVLGCLIIHFTNWHWIDPLLGLCIVGVILYGTWGLLIDSVNLIMDAVPRGIDQSAVKAHLMAIPGVETIHDLHIWGLSSKDVALTAHLVMPDKQLSDENYQNVMKDLKERFNIAHVTIQVERGHVDYPCQHTSTC